MEDNVKEKITADIDLFCDLAKEGKLDQLLINDFTFHGFALTEVTIRNFYWNKGYSDWAQIKNVTFIDGRIDEITFNDAIIENVTFDNITFIGASFDYYPEDRSFHKVTFKNCTFIDFSLTKAHECSIEFENCRFLNTFIYLFKASIIFKNCNTVKMTLKLSENIYDEPLKFINCDNIQMTLLFAKIKQLDLSAKEIVRANFETPDSHIESLAITGRTGEISMEYGCQINILSMLFWIRGTFRGAHLTINEFICKSLSESFYPGFSLAYSKIKDAQLLGLKHDRGFITDCEINKLTLRNCVYNFICFDDSTIDNLHTNYFFIREKAEFKNVKIRDAFLENSYIDSSTTWETKDSQIDKIEQTEDLLQGKKHIKGGTQVTGLQLKSYFGIKHYALPSDYKPPTPTAPEEQGD